jgi:hypothetical protein
MDKNEFSIIQTLVYYTCEDCTVTLQNPTLECLDEWLKEHSGHKIVTTRKHPLYDLGYNDLKKAEELAQIAEALGAIVADIRFMPHTRNPEFSQKHLREILGENYVHVGDLGNANYKGTGGIELENVESGMMILNGLLAMKPVILICACWKRSECHRLYVAEEYKRRYGLATSPISRQDARTLLESIKVKNNPQLSLFEIGVDVAKSGSEKTVKAVFENGMLVNERELHADN